VRIAIRELRAAMRVARYTRDATSADVITISAAGFTMNGGNDEASAPASVDAIERSSRDISDIYDTR